MDLEDPARLLGRADEWVFAPEESYKVLGDVDKVVFPCGWVYYGGGDKCISLAIARVSGLLDWLERNNRR